MTSQNDNLEHIVSKSRQAKFNGYGLLSRSEALAAALVLNRADWLQEMDYTIAQALDRIGDEWSQLVPVAARLV